MTLAQTAATTNSRKRLTPDDLRDLRLRNAPVKQAMRKARKRALKPCEHRNWLKIKRPCGCISRKVLCTYGTNGPAGVIVRKSTCRHCQKNPGWIESVAGTETPY